MHSHSTHLGTFAGSRAHRRPAAPKPATPPLQALCGFVVACSFIAALAFAPW